MPPIEPEDLPDEVRAILGAPADPFARPSEQPVCQPDARVTAQAVGEVRPRVRPAYIRNARKGDLILSPGGREGVVGALLWELDPPQLYSHMGIMTRDETEIRHATFSEERLQVFPHYAGLPENGALVPQDEFFPVTLGVDRPPTDAFQEGALRFGWPGTITQTVHAAWLNWQHSAPGLDGLDHPNKAGLRVFVEDALQDMEAKPLPERLVVRDPALAGRPDDGFKIHAMTFGAVTMEGGTIAHPLVVKPCPALDTEEVRAALERVADAVAAIRGHYRFFSYTDAAIALDDAHRGPPLLEETEPDPACAGAGGTRPTAGTIPVVCSTVIWAAVQRLNAQAAAAGLPEIQLVHPDSNEETTRRRCGGAPSTTPPSWADRPDPDGRDGLFFYGDSERGDAGEALFRHNRDRVAEIVLRNADLLASVKGAVGRSETVTSLWDVAKLIALLGAPATRILLDLTDDALARLVTLLSDMPDDVAHQLCNAFANDDCRAAAKDSTAWRDAPGTGVTVSPDNILRSWSSPVQATPERVMGLYGFNARAELVPPTWWPDPPPDTSWQISQGLRPCHVRVVLAPEDGAPEWGVEGAVVRVGGHPPFRSGPDGWQREVLLPEGVYWCDARWHYPALERTVESEGQVERIALDGDVPVIVIRMLPPPALRRRVWFSGEAHLVNRHAGAEIPLVDLFVKDWERRRRIDARHIPDALMDPLGFGFPPDDPRFREVVESARVTRRVLSLAIEDWGSAEVELTLTLQGDGAVEVAVRAGMRHGGDTDWTGADAFTVAPNASHGLVVRLREGIWPARASIDLTIFNERL